MHALWATGDGKVQAVALLVSTAAVDGAVLLGASRAMRITEVNEVVAMVTRRIRR